MEESEQERRDWLQRIGKTIVDQIMQSVSISVWFSWGVTHPTFTYYYDMPSLAFVANGALHKGWVIVSLNEGVDLYEIYLIAKDNQTVLKKVEGVYNDMLGKTLDGLIERPSGISNDEYLKLLRERGEPLL